MDAGAAGEGRELPVNCQELQRAPRDDLKAAVRDQRKAVMAMLAADLYRRRGESVIAPYVQRSIESWKPEPKQCHRNVDIWVAGAPGSRAVRGWMLFDVAEASLGLLNYVLFEAHSVVEENGPLVDIAPSSASRRYPFIRHPGDDQDFKKLVEHVGISTIQFKCRPEVRARVARNFAMVRGH